MKVLRKIIEIDEEQCDGCGKCVTGCEEGALQIIDGKACVVAESFCDGLGACIGECPTGALKIIEREADDFDPEAVEKHLAHQKQETMACGCPSTHIQSFVPSCPSAVSNESNRESALTHWPVQIRLIPPQAPFLKGANLLVLADCTPVAYPDLHHNMLKGKVVMLGCPKFDDPDDYVNRFTAIFKIADIKSITIAIMEVPCCSAFLKIVQQGMENAGKQIPLEQIVISPRGKIIRGRI